jgi:hypothetical protein
VGNEGPCLAIRNGEGKEGISSLDVTPTPCLDVTPLCHIKGWKPRGVEERPHRRGHASARSRVRPCGRAHECRVVVFFKTKFLKLKKTHYIMVQIVKKSN